LRDLGAEIEDEDLVVLHEDSMKKGQRELPGSGREMCNQFCGGMRSTWPG